MGLVPNRLLPDPEHHPTAPLATVVQAVFDRYAAGISSDTHCLACGDERRLLTAYLGSYPHEATSLSVPLQMLNEGAEVTSRSHLPLHVTVGALLVRGGAEVLLVDHLAYGILLQPGGHLEPTDASLIDAATRELAEETGVDLTDVASTSHLPVYVEYGKVPARPDKGEPEHFHLDFGYCFATACAQVGSIQESEVAGAAWYPLGEAERLVGHRIARSLRTSA
ncbi:NUDIX domain-containing protein [Micromonospora sp. NPDC047074]|uniref:NUDIX hydrolase n=1 Tax=Micromonospora sp. NPDC047074 TaxID=3154339 RepID=UPI0033BFF8D6